MPRQTADEHPDDDAEQHRDNHVYSRLADGLLAVLAEGIFIDLYVGTDLLHDFREVVDAVLADAVFLDSLVDLARKARSEFDTQRLA